MRCPETCCKEGLCRSKKYGSYRRKSDSRVIQRYYCKRCQKTYSTAVNDPAYHQNKRRINYPLRLMLASCISQRRAALLLGVSRQTVARKLVYLGTLCRQLHNVYLKGLEGQVEHMQFDELQTIEHTKCKPLSVAVAVCVKGRKILGVAVSSMPATGHLAAISRKKYGKRADKRKKGLELLFTSIKPTLKPHLRIQSDTHPYYFPMIKKHFPDAQYQQSIGKKAAVSGQGELKKSARDPLFCINHTLAMLRANINRLVRKTWCSTKKSARLADHLAIYMCMHNQVLTAKA